MGKLDAAAAAIATEPTNGLFAPFLRWLPSPTLSSLGVATRGIPGGGNGVAPAIGTDATAATLTALVQALALALISMLALSSGVIDGETARSAADAA